MGNIVSQYTNPYKNQPEFYASIPFRGSFDCCQSLQGGPLPVISKVISDNSTYRSEITPQKPISFSAILKRGYPPHVTSRIYVTISATGRGRGPLVVFLMFSMVVSGSLKRW